MKCLEVIRTTKLLPVKHAKAFVEGTPNCLSNALSVIRQLADGAL